MTTAAPPSENELHAYLDGELPEARRAFVEAYLREHPDDARRLDAYRADGEAIARIFSQNCPASSAKRSASAAPRRPRTAALRQISWRRIPLRQVSWRQMAAAVLLLAVGTGAGWLLPRGNSSDMNRLGHQAAAAHLIHDPGFESLATSPLDKLSQAMSRALGVSTELRDPSRTGYTIASARIVPQAKWRAVQLVMRGPAGEMITFYFEGRPGATETPMRRIAGAGVTTLVWEDDNLACAITGTLEPKKLEEVGRRVYDALIG